MKHINKKNLIRGAKKGAPKPQPAILNPPKLGGFKAVSSYSVAEIVDLISDGPIEGLVDQNGKTLSDSIFKGIYLDNTPLQNTEKVDDLGKIYEGTSIASLTNAISSIWIKNGKFVNFNFAKKSKGQALFYYRERLFALFVGLSPLLPQPRTNTFFDILDFRQYYWVSFPKYFRLSDNKIEIHRASPIVSQSPILKAFENDIVLESRNGDSVAKSIANKNIKKLDKIKIIMKDSFYGPDTPFGRIKKSYIIIDLRDSTLNSIKDIGTDKSLNFSISELSDRFAYVTTLAQPEISNGAYTGKVNAIVIIACPLNEAGNAKNFISYRFPKALLSTLDKKTIELRASEKSLNISSTDDSTFNFSNVSCEFRDGEEDQPALNKFDKVFNDFLYEAKLLGPFVKSARIQKINITNSYKDGIAGLNRDNLSVSQTDFNAGYEGSQDVRGKNNYSDWNDENEKKDYDSLSITHTIENPFVDKVCVSIAVNYLSDTVHTATAKVEGVGVIEAGAKIPSIVGIRIETGKINNGEKTSVQSYSYSIVGLIEGSCIIDFGADYGEAENLLKDSVRLIDGENLNDANLTRPFDIPPLADGEDASTTKRYVKVVKLSCETNSTLIKKDIALAKVTEIIDQKFSYPFSSIVGIKLDARSFGSVPERSYDCKLKKVKIPSNYEIKDDLTEADIRYVDSVKNYTVTKQIYQGDWDGTFTIGWTDNPAWILYDLLTSKRYGLGAYIDESQVNKWELYKIARFCDAVDDEGYFIGVSNGFGGLEPRFSCNVIFKEQTKVYDAINIIANLFRGIVFFGGSEIHFLDDRPRTPIALFNNANTKEGIFNYSNTRRDLQFNTVEVVYLDRFDNYKTKVEYIQNEEDIRKRGVFKTTINTLGVTSRAMARRIGQHIIYQTTKENQAVDFVAGLEALLCRPGDLIIVEDELKTRSTNYGKILDVDLVNKKLRIDNQFDSTQYTGFITIYTPTGYTTSSELDQLATTGRQRVEKFSITGDFLGNATYATLRGTYVFSGYTSGFNNDIYPAQFPLYTGTGSTNQKLFCYYNTGATGFVFATGLPFQNNNTYDKIITNTGVFWGADISELATGVESGNYTGFVYDSAVANKRGANGQVSGAISWDSNLYGATQGILDREINAYNVSQITKISLTGYDNTVDYGSMIFLNQNDPNINFLPAVKAGSVYRIERKSASDQIYKIISIRENSQNEYGVTATRYDTGKFEEIEKFITEDFLENTYYTGDVRVGNAVVKQVAIPVITTFSGLDQTYNGFKLTGRWTSGAGNLITGFNVSISNSLAGYFSSTTINETGVQFDGLTDIGNWELSVTALAKQANINSSTATTGTFVAYSGSDIITITKPAITSFSLQ